MKKTILLLVLILPSLALFGQNIKQVTLKHKNPWFTETFYVLTSKNSIKHGNYQKLGSQDAVLTNGFYKHGLKDSIWTEYYWGGKKIKSRGAYSQDEKIAVWEYYDPNGDIEQKYNHSESKLVFDRNIENQKNKEFTVINGIDTIKTKLDQGPIYIGGSVIMLGEMRIKSPKEALNKITSGTVYVSFVVDKKGKAINHQVQKGIGFGCDEEALRVVKLIEDNWIPGHLDGKPVDVLFIQPIGFQFK